MEDVTRLREQSITLAGLEGLNIDIPSTNPLNYHQVVNDPNGCEPLVVDGKLFLPSAEEPLPLVMVVPGSLGVAESHLAPAKTIRVPALGTCSRDLLSDLLRTRRRYLG